MTGSRDCAAFNTSETDVADGKTKFDPKTRPPRDVGDDDDELDRNSVTNCIITVKDNSEKSMP